MINRISKKDCLKIQQNNIRADAIASAEFGCNLDGDGGVFHEFFASMFDPLVNVRFPQTTTLK